MMKFDFKIGTRERRLSIALLLITALVIISMVFAFKTIKDLWFEKIERIENKNKSTYFKDVLVELSLSENLIKYYSISKDIVYLKSFYQSGKRISTLFFNINAFTINSKKEQKIIFLTQDLIEKKLSLLNEYLHLYQDEKIVALTKSLGISIKPKSVPLDSVSNLKKESTRKKIGNWLSNAFVPKSKVYQEQKKKSDSLLFSFKSKVESTSTKQMNLLKEIRIEEIRINKADKILSDLIQNNIFKLEELELIDEVLKKEIAQENLNSSKSWFILFCLTYILLLIIVFRSIIKYAKNNYLYINLLKNAKMEAETLAQNKEKFISTVNHELRTPMNALMGFTEQLWNSDLSDTQRKMVYIIKDSSDHLLKIINDLLSFSKLKSGKIIIERSKFNLFELVDSLNNIIQPLLQKDNNLFNYSIDKNIQQVLIGDELRVRQVLLNVIGNAIKFTSNGKINLEIGIKEKDGNKLLLEFKVRDTGIGIPANKLKIIFNEFEQVEPLNQQKFEGTGLGLSITKSLLELLSGSIEISSEVAKGTIVRMLIPFFKENVLGESKEKNHLDNETHFSKNQINVLLADDEKYNRDLINSVLLPIVGNIESVTNGVELMESFEKNKYQLILLDYKMPGKNGKECIKEIRLNFKSEIPIILISAYTSNELWKDNEQYSNLYFLQKPFKSAELIHLISKIFPYEIENEIRLTYNFSDLYLVSGGDSKFVFEMLNTLESTIIEILGNIAVLIESENSKLSLLDELHKISGPIKHIEAIEIVKIIEQLESEIRLEDKFEVNKYRPKINKMLSLFNSLLEVIKLEKSKNL